MRAGPFDFGVLAAPFRQGRAFLIACAMALLPAAIVFHLGRLIWPGFAGSAYGIGNLVFLVTLVFDAAWLAALQGRPLARLWRLPLEKPFWKFSLVWIVLNIGFVVVAFTLRLNENDTGFNALHARISHLIARSDHGPAPDGALSWLEPLLILLCFYLVWLRLSLTLWPARVMATGHIGSFGAARMLTQSCQTDLVMIGAGLAAPAIVLGMILFIPLSLMTAPLFDGFADIAAVLLIACLFRAMLAAVYVEQLATMAEHGEIEAMTAR